MKDLNWGLIIAKTITILIPVLMTVLIFLVKTIMNYFQEKIKNSKLKNLYGWLNKEVVSALVRVKQDDELRELINKSLEDGILTDAEKKIIIRRVKQDVLDGVPSSLLKEFKTLIGDIEHYVERQIKVFFSQDSQEN